MLRCTANATKVEPKAEQQDMPQKEPIHDSDTGNANKPEKEQQRDTELIKPMHLFHQAIIKRR